MITNFKLFEGSDREDKIKELIDDFIVNNLDPSTYVGGSSYGGKIIKVSLKSSAKRFDYGPEKEYNANEDEDFKDELRRLIDKLEFLDPDTGKYRSYKLYTLNNDGTFELELK